MSGRALWFPLALALAIPLAPPQAALAQEAEEAEPPARVMAVTRFDVPYQDQAAVWRFLRDYYLPGLQLNPKVVNLRVMTHLYGSDASEVIILHEYADWADIEAPCGQACDDYGKDHPTPSEGSPEWEAFSSDRSLFQKYYSGHRDEVYSVIAGASKLEGRLAGRVGPPPATGDSSGGGAP